MPDSPGPEVEIIAHPDLVEVRFLGDFSVERFNRQADLAARACADRQISLLLVDLSALSRAPTTIERYQISSYGAAVGSKLQIATVDREEHMDPKRFGMMVARNRGATLEVFTDREKALAWLLARKEG